MKIRISDCESFARPQTLFFYLYPFSCWSLYFFNVLFKLFNQNIQSIETRKRPSNNFTSERKFKIHSHLRRRREIISRNLIQFQARIRNDANFVYNIIYGTHLWHITPWFIWKQISICSLPRRRRISTRQSEVPKLRSAAHAFAQLRNCDFDTYTRNARAPRKCIHSRVCVAVCT